MTEAPRCPTCKRWAYPGERHICLGELARCTNPRCRRLLPWLRTGLCTRCQVQLALAAAGSGQAALPVNTGRGSRGWRRS